jgi:hypothetical protein
MCDAYSETDDDMPMELERLLDELTSLKNKLDEWFRRTKNNNQCGNGTTDEYFENIAKFLIGNQTMSEENKSHKPGFFKKLKQKILNIIRGKNSTESSPHVRRCVAASLKIPKKKEKNQDPENFHQYLTKVINCLETNKKTVPTSGENASGFKFITTHNLAILHADESDNSNLSVSYESTTESRDQENAASESKIDNILKYLADSHHTVEEAGRAGYKPPDLRKTQEIINSVKNSMMNFNLDDDETTSTTCDPFSANEIRKRNIFDDFAKKFESKSRKFDVESKTNVKMNENGIFDGMPKIDEDFRELGGSDEYENERQKSKIDEGKLLDHNLRALSSKLDVEQQMVVLGLRNEKK